MKKLLAMIALWVATLPMAMVAHASPTLIVGEPLSWNVGDTFTVSVRIADAVDLKSFQFDLAYDPLVLEAVGFSDLGTDFESAAIAGGGSLTGITGFMLPGVLSGVADSMSGVLDGLNGNGVLATIEFRAIGLGVSPLALSSAFLDFLPLDDAALVSGSVSVPEPAAFWLVMLALAALASGRRPVRPPSLR